MSQDDVERVARAICAEKCAYMGEPACWTFKEETWPPPACDEPGCVSEARAALSALPERELLAEALEALRPFAVGARSIDVDPPGDHEPSHGRGSVRAGDLRRARAAADKIRAALTQEKQP